MLDENLRSVKQRISKACERSGRPPQDVRLICVTKQAVTDDIRAVLALGVVDLGESRVQDAAAKYAAIDTGAAWHLVGHLQTNKAKDAVRIFSLIHSVDSLRLARAIDKEASKAGKVQDILIQVNISGEAAKFGIPPSGLEDTMDGVRALNNIRIKGLMTIAPEAAGRKEARDCFRALRELRDKLRNAPYPVRELSMGMTNDFEVAIEEGSTMVRIGRAIFHA